MLNHFLFLKLGIQSLLLVAVFCLGQGLQAQSGTEIDKRTNELRDVFKAVLNPPDNTNQNIVGNLLGNRRSFEDLSDQNAERVLQEASKDLRFFEKMQLLNELYKTVEPSSAEDSAARDLMQAFYPIDPSDRRMMALSTPRIYNRYRGLDSSFTSPTVMWTDRDIDFAIRFLRGAAAAEKMEYDGINSEIVYHDQRVEQVVNAIFGSLFFSTPEQIASFVDRAGPLLTEDNNRLDAASRIEIFDLLADRYEELLRHRFEDTTTFWNSDYKMDPRFVSAIARSALRKKLGVPAEPYDLPIFAIRDARANSKKALIVCAGDDHEEESFSTFGDSYGGSLYGLKFKEVDFGRTRSTTIECQGRSYTIQPGETSSGSLSFPVDTNFGAEIAKDQELHFLATMSLTEAVKPSSVKGLITLLEMNGFNPEINPETGEAYFIVDDVKEEFKEKFVQANAYFPAGSRLEASRLDIVKGDGDGIKLVLQKVYPATETLPERKAHFTILLPPIEGSKNGIVHVTRGELAELLCDRREVQNNPALLMTLSCDSHETVRSWMNAYRDSVQMDVNSGELSLDEIQDVPLVIGARRGFDSGSIKRIAESMGFGLMTIDQIMNGQEAKAIVDRLERPIDDEFYDRLAKIPGLKIARDRRAHFSPFCNRDPSTRDLYSFSNLLNEIIIRTEGDSNDEYRY